MAIGAGGLRNGKVSMSPRREAFMRKMTSAKLARWISGCVNGDRAS